MPFILKNRVLSDPVMPRGGLLGRWREHCLAIPVNARWIHASYSKFTVFVGEGAGGDLNLCHFFLLWGVEVFPHSEGCDRKQGTIIGVVPFWKDNRVTSVIDADLSFSVFV